MGGVDQCDGKRSDQCDGMSRPCDGKRSDQCDGMSRPMRWDESTNASFFVGSI